MATQSKYNGDKPKAKSERATNLNTNMRPISPIWKFSSLFATPSDTLRPKTKHATTAREKTALRIRLNLLQKCRGFNWCSIQLDYILAGFNWNSHACWFGAWPIAFNRRYTQTLAVRRFCFPIQLQPAKLKTVANRSHITNSECNLYSQLVHTRTYSVPMWLFSECVQCWQSK